MPKKDRTFDVRTIESFVREGKVSREDYAKHLESLPDVADKAAPMESTFVEGVLDDDAGAADSGDDS